jgi:hypothetical protein
MSEPSIDMVIEHFQNEGLLRVRVALERIERLATRSVRGKALTPIEVDVFFELEYQFWYWSRAAVRERAH